MTLTQLRYAVAVDTFRHFGQAADHCCVSQPTLSAQLQKLEEGLGVPLFDRESRPVRPTDAGRLVLAQARVVLHEADRLRELVQSRTEALRGPLRLGLLPTLAPGLLPLVAGPFAARFPDARLDVREMQTDAILEALRTETLDAGLVATDVSVGFETRALFDEPFVPYLQDGHPLSGPAPLRPTDLPPAELWLLAEGHCFRDQVLDACGAPETTTLPVRFETGSLETLRLLVDTVGGLTLLPALTARQVPEAHRARLVPFAAPVPQRTVRLVYGQTHLRRGLVEAFAALVVEVVRPLLADAGAAAPHETAS